MQMQQTRSMTGLSVLARLEDARRQPAFYGDEGTAMLADAMWTQALLEKAAAERGRQQGTRAEAAPSKQLSDMGTGEQMG